MSESGRSAVYVRPYPGPGRAVRVSTGDGRFVMVKSEKGAVRREIRILEPWSHRDGR